MKAKGCQLKLVDIGRICGNTGSEYGPEMTTNFYVFVSDNPLSSYDLNTTLSQPGVSNFLIPVTPIPLL